MSKKRNIPLFISPKKKQEDEDEEDWTEETPDTTSQAINLGQLLSSQQTTLEDKGIFIFQREVSSESLEKIMRKILELHFDENFIEPIQIMLNSPGGTLNAGFALIDLMKFIKNPVRTIAMGEIASMGTMIFMAGDQRIITSNTSVMIHHFSTSTYGTYFDLKAESKVWEQIHKRVIKFFIDNSKYRSEKQIRKHLLLEQDNWLTPEDMIEHGLADHIYRPEKKKIFTDAETDR